MKAMTTIFNDINYNEIEVYVDDGITKFCQISDQLKRLESSLTGYVCMVLILTQPSVHLEYLQGSYSG